MNNNQTTGHSEFTPLEERIMVRCGDLSLTARMKRATAAVTLLFLVLFIAAGILSRSYIVVTVLGSVYVLLTLFEKLGYIRVIGACRSVIFKQGKALNNKK